MSSGDETRVMPVPAEIRSLMKGPTPAPEAETPCVGVPSVGDTHFGETQLAVENPRIPESQPALTKSIPAAPVSQRTRSPESPPKATVARVPRALALGIGAIVGVGTALLLGGVPGAHREPRSAPATFVQVDVGVQTEEGRGVPEVPVRVANQVVLTDEEGNAPFSPILLEGALNVEAECPSGYTGGRLSRKVPKAVALASKSWSFQLVCRPEFSDVSLVVAARGCGEMKIWVDGRQKGTTSGGTLTLSRRIHTEEVVEVRVEPVEGHCEMESVRHVSLSPSDSFTRLAFEGKVPRGPTFRAKKTPPAPSRPYRL